MMVKERVSQKRRHVRRQCQTGKIVAPRDLPPAIPEDDDAIARLLCRADRRDGEAPVDFWFGYQPSGINSP